MNAGAGESAVIASVAMAIAFHVVCALVLFAWGRWVARRRGTAGWRRAAWMPIGALVTAAVGIVVSVFGLLRAFGAVASVDAADKARVLAQAISESMNAAVFFAIPSALLYVASLLAFAIGSLASPPQAGRS